MGSITARQRLSVIRLVKNKLPRSFRWETMEGIKMVSIKNCYTDIIKFIAYLIVRMSNEESPQRIVALMDSCISEVLSGVGPGGKRILLTFSGTRITYEVAMVELIIPHLWGDAIAKRVKKFLVEDHRRNILPL